MDWLDRAVAALSPEWGLRRLKARARLGNLQRSRAYYDGATWGRRTEGWRRPTTGPNAEIRGALRILRDSHRDLVRNNPWAAKACSAIPDDVVGYGITYSIKHPTPRTEKALQALAKEHLETTAIDADGRHDIFGLQWLAMRSIVEGGEGLARRRFRRPSDGLSLPFQIQLMEPDHIDTLKEGPIENNALCIQGIEFLPTRKRAAYWLFQEHPGEGMYSARTDSRRIPAEDICHVYRVDRAGQVRGIPWGAPAIVAMKDFQDYQDNQLVRQKIAAAFGPIEIDPDGTPPSRGETGYDAPVTEAMEAGMFTRATPGYDLRFPSLPSMEGYTEHSIIELRKIAAAYGVPYEVLTGDLTNTNFASGRLGRLPYFRSIDQWLWRMLIPGFCDVVGAWFLESAEIIVPGARQATFTWTPAPRLMQDPTKEVPAKVAEVNGAMTTLHEMLRERGVSDIPKWMAEYEEGMAWARKMNLSAYAPAAPMPEIPDDPDMTPNQRKQARALGLVS